MTSKDHRFFRRFSDLALIELQEHAEWEKLHRLPPSIRRTVREAGEPQPDPRQQQQAQQPQQGGEQQPQQQQPQDQQAPVSQFRPLDFGQIYELKLLYSKLIAIARLLNFYSEDEFDELKVKVMEATDYFHTIITNFTQFQTRIGEVLYYYKLLIGQALEELHRSESLRADVRKSEDGTDDLEQDSKDVRRRNKAKNPGRSNDMQNY